MELCSLPVIYLWPNLVEVMWPPSKGPIHALLHSVPPTLQQATTNPHLHWRLGTLTGKSGSVSCGVTAPFSWVLVCTRFCCDLQESVSPVLCKFWWLYGGINCDLLHDGLCHTQVCCAQSPCPAAVHCWPVPPQETLKHSSGSVSVGSLVSWCTQGLSPLSISGGFGVWY